MALTASSTAESCIHSHDAAHSKIYKPASHLFKPSVGRLQKRGQLTIFIIVAVVIAISSLLIYSLRAKLYPERTIIDPLAEPVKVFTISCLDQTTRDGIALMGQQGGHIAIPQGTQRVQNIPLWWQAGESRIPSIAYMEDSLGQYVLDNLNACIDDFVPLQNNLIVEPTAPEVMVSIRDQEVSVDMTYPITVRDKLRGRSARIQEFSTIVPIPLGRAQALGMDIVQNAQSGFFENATLDLMGMDKNIPFTGFDIACGRKAWSVSAIRQEAQNLAYYHLSKARFTGTDYTPFLAPEQTYEQLRRYTIEDANAGRQAPDAPDDAWDYFHLLMRLDGNYPGFRAGVMVPNNLQLRARPSTGDTMSPRSGVGGAMLSLLCFNVYHFTYDVRYDVIISARDDSSGFTLRFGLPVTIDHNAPARHQTTFSTFQAPMDDLGLCRDLGPVRQINAIGYHANNPEFPLIANISFHCFTFRCDLGETPIGSRVLQTGLPDNCVGGYVMANAPGFLQGKQQDTGGDITIALTAVQDVAVQVQKAPVFYTTQAVRDTEALADDEAAVIRLTSTEYPDYESSMYVDKDATDASLQLILADTTYQVEATLVDAKGIKGGWRGNVTIPFGTAQDAGRIRFTLAEGRPTPITDGQVSAMLDFLENNQSYRVQLPVVVLP